MKIVILGGGISGLSAAWFARKKYPDAEILLFEKKNQLGGCIATHKQGPFVFEMGPRTFQRSRSPQLLSLISQLGLEKELVFSDPASKKRFLWTGGRLRGMGSFWPQMGVALARDLLAPRGRAEDESIYAFASRRFGKRAAELFFDPLTKGVFGGDMHKLSLSACFPALRQMEESHRSIVLGMRGGSKQPSGLFTLRGGMSRLIEALSQMPIEFHLGSEVEALHQDGVVVEGRKWRADQIISALPGLVIAKLVGIHLNLRNEHLSVVNLGYEGKTTLRGYGYLVPSSEKEELLGQIWDSAVFPEPLTRLTSMVRSQNPEATALEAMRRHLGERREPAALNHSHAIIPQYDVGHKGIIERFEAESTSRYPCLHLVGNYLSGPSVEACIARAIKIFSTN